MWFKSAASNSGGGTGGRRSAPSILSEGFRVDGDIASSGEVHVAGTLIGNVVAGKVTLGESGSINGSVEAETAIINGALQGRLVAVNVILGRSAQVRADVVYCSMRIEPGAVFEGYSRRVERENLSEGEGKQLLPALKALRPAEHSEAVAPAQAGE
ncbi:MAG TPA: polymer-forming cytoskeletal protein [Stellaceae bacterium]|jgi:cytoskeletal protein CcmA (bactofilin family)|nr:polymer-forming cytoskeletal protein [Stellaceae bacterium]